MQNNDPFGFFVSSRLSIGLQATEHCMQAPTQPFDEGDRTNPNWWEGSGVSATNHPLMESVGQLVSGPTDQ